MRAELTWVAVCFDEHGHSVRTGEGGGLVLQRVHPILCCIPTYKDSLQHLQVLSTAASLSRIIDLVSLERSRGKQHVGLKISNMGMQTQFCFHLRVNVRRRHTI